MELITTSRLRASRACRRLHHFKYEKKRRPRVVPLPMAFGTLMHVGLEGWWKAVQVNQQATSRTVTTKDRWGVDRVVGGHTAEVAFPLASALMAMDDSYAASMTEESELDEYEMAKARALMRGYNARWEEFALTVEVLHVEAEFCGPLLNPDTGKASRTFALGGKIDVIVRVIATGDVYLVEHKTTSKDISPGAMYWVKLKMDPQISTYHRGAEIMGYEVCGTIYDVIRKPSFEPYKETSDDLKKYTLPKACKACVEAARSAPASAGKKKLTAKELPAKDVPLTEGCEDCEPSRLYANMHATDEPLEEYRQRLYNAIANDPQWFFQHGDVVRLESELAEHARDTWVEAKFVRESQRINAHPRNPDHCEYWNRLCEYWDVCTGCASIDDDLQFKDSEQHAELSTQKAS